MSVAANTACSLSRRACSLTRDITSETAAEVTFVALVRFVSFASFVSFVSSVFVSFVSFVSVPFVSFVSAPTRAADPWQLTWSDEFDQPDGSAPDPSRWVYDLGGAGWGNNELETYTDRRENSVIRDGMLVIRAVEERYRGRDGIERPYTSARLKTEGRFAQTHGKFEARIKLPRGQGIWPAFWMLGSNCEAAGWPDCGEIDIVENIGREPTVAHGTIHGPGYSGAGGLSGSFKSTGGALADGFHVFAIEWDATAIRWYVDGVLYSTRTPRDLPEGRKWVFDHPFSIILNVAVGGNWPGNPDASTTFPQEMLIDWVRVYLPR